MNERCAAFEKFKKTCNELKDVFSNQKAIYGEITGRRIISRKPTQRDRRHSDTTSEVFFQSGIVRTIVALEAYIQNLFKEAFKEIKRYYKSLGLVPNEKKNAPQQSSLDTRGQTQGNCGADAGKEVSGKGVQAGGQTGFNVDEQIQDNLFQAQKALTKAVTNLSMQLDTVKKNLRTIFPEKGYRACDMDKKPGNDQIDKKLDAVLAYIAGGEAKGTGDASGGSKVKASVGEGTSSRGATIEGNAQGSHKGVVEASPANPQINVRKSVKVNVEAEARTVFKPKVPTLKLVVDSKQCTAQLPEKDGLRVITHLSKLLYGLRCALVHGSVDATLKGALKGFALYQEDIAMWGTLTTGKTEHIAELDRPRDTVRDGSERYNVFQYFQQLGRSIKFSTLWCDYNMFLNVQNACSFLAYIWTRILGLYIYDLISADLSGTDKNNNHEFVTRGKFWEWHATELKAARNLLQTAK